MNRIVLDQSDGGFVVNDTVNACTKGLWIWSEPIKGVTSSGLSVSVLVVDTEGLGDTENDRGKV